MGTVDEFINLYLPIPGVATSLIGVLVIIRLVLFILAADPGHKNPLKQPGNWMVYVMVAVFISPWALLAIIPLHWVKVEFHEHRLARGEGDPFGMIPEKQGDAKDVAVFFVAALFAVVFAQFPRAQAYLSQYFPLDILHDNKVFWIFGLFVFVFVSYRSMDSESFREVFKQNIITFVLVLMFFGFGALHIYLIYHLVLPFFAKFKPFGRGRYAASEVSAYEYYEPAYAGAPGPTFGERVSTVGSKLGDFAKIFASEKAGTVAAKETAAKEAAKTEAVKEAAQIQKGELKVAEREAEEAREERREAVSASRRAEAISKRQRISQLTKELPVHFWLAMIIAIISDALDYVGLAVPGIGDIAEPITGYLIGRSMGGTPYTYLFAFIPVVIEFIPGADLIPTYVICVPIIYILDYIFNPKRRELRELKKGEGLELHNIAYAMIMIILVVAGMVYFQVPVGKYANNLYETGIIDVAFQQKKVEIWAEDIRPMQWAKDWWGEQVALATGDAFTATVDASKDKNYGVKLAPSKVGDITFERGIPASVTAELSGNSLASDICSGKENLAECVIDLSCEIEGEGVGRVYPQRANFSDLVFGGERVDCDFTPLEPGAKKVEFKADFDFITVGYYKAYFVDRELKLEFQRQGETVLQAKGIPEPEAQYTPGPVMVGVGFSEGSVIAVQSGAIGAGYEEEMPTAAATLGFEGITGAIIAQDRGAAMGVTLKNQWRNGKITAIHNISVIMPNVFKMAEGCTPEFVKVADLPKTNEVEYGLKKPLDTNIENFRTFNCRIEAVNPNAILTGVDVTPYYIKSVARYRYTLSAKTVVRIKDYDKTLAPGINPKGSLYDTCLTDVSGCDYPDRKYCDIDACGNNCYWQYASRKPTATAISEAGTYLISPALGISASRTVAEWVVGDSCESCGSSMSCSEYPNKEQCLLDPCNINCDWDDEFSMCRGFPVEDMFIWPADTKAISKCIDGLKEVKISAENQKIVSPESGEVSVKGDSGLEIKHPNGYTTTFEGIRRARKAGNIAKGELVGYAGKDLTFKITKDGKSLDLKTLYQNTNKKEQLIIRDPDCLKKNEPQTNITSI
ncbi:M23 family metallopeptidase [Candidatus Woesearchaeota archaeon]|nr:M23 family metallopeptidase [Candidatus Woesearchaeota archaeon]